MSPDNKDNVIQLPTKEGIATEDANAERLSQLSLEVLTHIEKMLDGLRDIRDDLLEGSSRTRAESVGLVTKAGQLAALVARWDYERFGESE